MLRFSYSNRLMISLVLLLVGSLVKAETLSLSQAVSEARSHSPKILKTKSIYEETSWKKVESYSGFLPSLNLNTTYWAKYRYLLTDMNLGAGPISIPGIVPTSNFVLTAQLPIFDGFASTNRYLAAKSFETAAKSDLDWTQFQLDREVALQFYKALGAQVLRQVAEQNLKTIEDHLRDVSQFKKAGLSTNYDVLRVEVQVSEAKSELMNATDNAEISKSKLSEILGLDSDRREISGALPVLGLEAAKNLSPEKINERFDLKALQSRVKGFDELESASSRYFVPRINFVGQYQFYNNRNDRFDDFDNYREAYQLGVSLVWNIFDGMISTAKSKQSIEQRYQAEKTLQIAQIKAKQDLEIWKRKFNYFCSVYKFRASDVEKSTESVRLAKEGRKVGSRTNTDLLDAESELFRARAGLVNSQIGAVEALINLELALGTQLVEFN